jgi:hypothetical protein
MTQDCILGTGFLVVTGKAGPWISILKILGNCFVEQVSCGPESSTQGEDSYSSIREVTPFWRQCPHLFLSCSPELI